MKRAVLVLAVLLAFCTPAFANGGENTRWYNPSNWFVKGQLGITGTQSKYETGDLLMTGKTQVLRLVYDKMNMAIQGGWELMQDQKDIDFYSGKAVFFTRDPHVQDKINPYLISGLGFAHTDQNQMAFDVGFGFLIPFQGGTPLVELNAFSDGENWKLNLTIGMQIGIGLKY